MPHHNFIFLTVITFVLLQAAEEALKTEVGLDDDDYNTVNSSSASQSVPDITSVLAEYEKYVIIGPVTHENVMLMDRWALLKEQNLQNLHVACDQEELPYARVL